MKQAKRQATAMLRPYIKHLLFTFPRLLLASFVNLMDDEKEIKKHPVLFAVISAIIGLLTGGIFYYLYTIA